MVDEAQNVEQLIERISSKRPDLAEFRLDRLQNSGLVEKIGRAKTLPAIATDRSKRINSESEELLLAAAASGFEYVDLDVGRAHSGGVIEKVKACGARIIMSHHDHTRTPSVNDLSGILRSQQENGADLFKIVTTAQRPRDNLTVLGFLENKPTDTKLVSFAMGSIGVPSRVLSPVFGAEFTFAALTDDSATADGQLSIDRLRSVWQSLGLQ